MTLFDTRIAENEVLCAFVKHFKDTSKYISMLMPEDFSEPGNEVIFRSMLQCVNEDKPTDLPNISTEMIKLFGNDMQMNQLIDIIQHFIGSTANIKTHINTIKDASNRRKMVAILENTKRRIVDASEDFNSVRDETITGMKLLETSTQDKIMTMQDILLESFGIYEDRTKRIDRKMLSGINDLDKLTGGFHRGEMTIIGARPAVGKSAFGMQIALEAAKQGFRVCLCSREMTAEQYSSRVIVRSSKIDNLKLRTGNIDEKDWGEIADAVTLNAGLPITFLFNTPYIEDLKRQVSNLKSEQGLDMLVIDYIQLMRTRRRFDKDYQRIAEISQTLKALSTDLNISVIALAQVGRDAEGSLPTLAELRGSGDMEQDADNVIFLHRPEDEKDKSIHPKDRSMLDTLKSMKRQYIVMRLAKQRQGSTGTTGIIFDPSHMRYININRGGEEGVY